jgi:hypothetical protein
VVHIRVSLEWWITAVHDQFLDAVMLVRLTVYTEDGFAERVVYIHFPDVVILLGAAVCIQPVRVEGVVEVVHIHLSAYEEVHTQSPDE